MGSQQEETSLESSQQQEAPQEEVLEMPEAPPQVSEETPSEEEETPSPDLVDSPEEPLQAPDPEDSPSQDSPEEPSSEEEAPEEASEESDEAPAEGDEVDAEAAEAPEGEPEEEAATEPEEASEEDVFSWGVEGLEDVSLVGVSEEARPAVREVLNNIGAKLGERVAALDQTRSDFEAQRASFSEIEEKFTKFMGDLEGDEEKRAEEFKRTTFVNQLLSQDSSRMAWDALTRMYGDAYTGLPSKVKEEFNAIVYGSENSPSSLFDYGGDKAHYLDRLEAALKEACTRGGVDPIQPFSSARAPKRNKGAARQAAISDGETPPLNPVTTVADATYDELMNKHEHLLG